MEATDIELLTAFAKNQDEAAFRALVERHLRMVFATARRMLDDSHEAEEISQSVFQMLAEKAGAFDKSQPLAGWLYHTTRHHALHRLRSEGRRRQREHTAFAMHSLPQTPPPETGLVHELEDALEELETDERDALVLRFLEDRQLKEVGSELGVSEEAARKRVTRALDRLRRIFGRRGITTSTGAITTALVVQSTIGVPASLGGTIISSVLTGTALAAGTAAIVTQTATNTMTTLFNLKTAAAVIAAAALTGTTAYLVKEKEVDQLRAEQSAMAADHAQLAADQQQATVTLQFRDDQIAKLKTDVAELPRLRGEIDRLNRALTQMAALRQENEDLKETTENLASQANKAIELEEQLENYEKKRNVVTLNVLKRVGLLLVRYASENDGWLPEYNEVGDTLLQTLNPEWSIDPFKVEIVYHGRLPDIDVPAKTILARELTIRSSIDGQQIMRGYTFADGHSEMKTVNDLQELTDWEQQRIIPSER